MEAIFGLINPTSVYESSQTESQMLTILQDGNREIWRWVAGQPQSKLLMRVYGDDNLTTYPI